MLLSSKIGGSLNPLGGRRVNKASLRSNFFFSSNESQKSAPYTSSPPALPPPPHA
jgi:hypothetical protein